MGNAVLFDWDGVIADSAYLYFDMYVRLCAKYGKNLPVSDLDAFRKWYNPQWELNYYEMGFKKEDFPEIFKFSSAVSYDKVNIFPGAEDMLRTLSAKYPVAIVSTTVSSIILEKLRREGLDKYILHITGGEDGKSEKIVKIADTLKLLGCTNGVMIGDTPVDIASGKANRLKTAGVTYGWIDAGRIRESKPDRIADDPLQLCGIICQLMESLEAS
ncbi:MAG: HAD family hydrolase [bacterium]|nr:HAD family hydrolase [bacterium]